MERGVYFKIDAMSEERKTISPLPILSQEYPETVVVQRSSGVIDLTEDSLHENDGALSDVRQRSAMSPELKSTAESPLSDLDGIALLSRLQPADGYTRNDVSDDVKAFADAVSLMHYTNPDLQFTLICSNPHCFFYKTPIHEEAAHFVFKTLNNRPPEDADMYLGFFNRRHKKTRRSGVPCPGRFCAASDVDQYDWLKSKNPKGPIRCKPRMLEYFEKNVAYEAWYTPVEDEKKRKAKWRPQKFGSKLIVPKLSNGVFIDSVFFGDNTDLDHGILDYYVLFDSLRQEIVHLLNKIDSFMEANQGPLHLIRDKGFQFAKWYKEQPGLPFPGMYAEDRDTELSIHAELCSGKYDYPVWSRFLTTRMDLLHLWASTPFDAESAMRHYVMSFHNSLWIVLNNREAYPMFDRPLNDLTSYLEYLYDPETPEPTDVFLAARATNIAKAMGWWQLWYLIGAFDYESSRLRAALTVAPTILPMYVSMLSTNPRHRKIGYKGLPFRDTVINSLSSAESGVPLEFLSQKIERLKVHKEKKKKAMPKRLMSAVDTDKDTEVKGEGEATKKLPKQTSTSAAVNIVQPRASSSAPASDGKLASPSQMTLKEITAELDGNDAEEDDDDEDDDEEDPDFELDSEEEENENSGSEEDEVYEGTDEEEDSYAHAQPGDKSKRKPAKSA